VTEKVYLAGMNVATPVLKPPGFLRDIYSFSPKELSWQLTGLNCLKEKLYSFAYTVEKPLAYNSILCREREEPVLICMCRSQKWLFYGPPEFWGVFIALALLHHAEEGRTTGPQVL
jgi:hypothetical protein